MNGLFAGGFTALRIAASNGTLTAVETLLAAGVDPKAKTDGGKTRTDFAIEGDYGGVVAILERASERRLEARPHFMLLSAELSSLKTFSKYASVFFRTASGSLTPCMWKSPTMITFVLSPMGT